MARRAYYLKLSFFAAVLLIACDGTSAYNGKSKLQERAEKLISEGALLKPIAAYGDTVHYVQDIRGGYMCGITNGRLMTFRRNNIRDVVGSYWLPSRSSRVFAYYQKHVYLLRNNGGITILDVTDPENIRLVGEIEIRLGVYANFELVEDKLFVVDCRDNSLVVFSLAAPASPAEISRTPLGETNASNPKSSVTVTDERIYLLADRKLFVLDKQTKAILGKLDVLSEIGPGGLAVSEPYVYVFGSRELLTIDASNPEMLEEKSRIKTEWCSRAEMRDGHIMGYGSNGVFAFDLADPANPTASEKVTNDISAGILIGKSQDYVVDSDGSISPLQDLNELSKGGQPQGFRARNIIVRDKFAYLAGGGKLRILDISRPWAPRQVSKTSLHSEEQVTINGNHLFTSGGIIDLSNPEQPREVKRLNQIGEVAVSNGLLFSARGNSLEIMDVKEVLDVNTPNPRVLKRIGFSEKLEKVLAHKGVVYLGFDTGKLRSCKVEGNLNLTTLDEMQLAEGSGCILRDMCQEDDLIYVALYEMGIVSVDVEDASDLLIYARFNTPKFAERVVVSDAFAYVADGQGGTIIVDMARQGYEKIVASYPTTDWTRGIGVSGNYVFSCEGDNGIAVFISSLSELKKKSPVVVISEEEEVPSPADGIKVPADYKETLSATAESLIAEGALLEPVAALGDSCCYAVEIGENLMCGITGQRLKIFRKDNIEEVVGSYWLGRRGEGVLEYYSGYVYLSQRNKGLKIFDIRDPSGIRLVGEMEPSLENCPKIAVRNDKLLFLDSLGKAIVIMSLADPANPKEVSRRTLGNRNISWYDCSFSLSDGRIYVLGRETREDFVLAIVDAAEVYSPTLVGIYDLEKGTAESLTVNNNYIYTYDGSKDLFHIHKLLGEAGIEYKGAVKAHPPLSLRLSLPRGTHIIGIWGGACVYDLTDPLKPELIRHHYNQVPNDFVVTRSLDYKANSAGQLEPIEGFPHFLDGRGRFDYYAENMAVQGDYLYMFGGGELRVLDISEPWNPKYAGLLTRVYGGNRNVLIKGDYIFTGREVIDISEPSRPKLVKELSSGDSVTMNDDHLFVDCGNSIGVWDIGNPAQAKFIKAIPLEDKVSTLFYHDDIMYMSLPEVGFFYYGLEDDLSLTPLGQIQLGNSQYTDIKDYFWQDNLLFLAVNDTGIISLDMRDPFDPQVHSRSEAKHIRQISVVNSLVYAVDNRATYLIDMTEGGSGKEIASYPAAHSFGSIAVSGNYVYSCDDQGGLVVFVSNPALAR
ncbi:MAG TPA: hypothetical protein VMX13_06925 [Sedimentisphaerales bacterium]|nr:hypothetical protein [Sedimentisphaerales bacterium]